MNVKEALELVSKIEVVAAKTRSVIRESKEHLLDGMGVGFRGDFEDIMEELFPENMGENSKIIRLCVNYTEHQQPIDFFNLMFLVKRDSALMTMLIFNGVELPSDISKAFQDLLSEMRE